MLNEVHVQERTGHFIYGFNQGDMGIFSVLRLITCMIAGIKSSIQWKKCIEQKPDCKLEYSFLSRLINLSYCVSYRMGHSLLILLSLLDIVGVKTKSKQHSIFGNYYPIQNLFFKLCLKA